MKKKVLATSEHTGGVNAISPVIKNLKEERKVNVVVIGYQNSEEIFKNNSVYHRTIDDCGLEDISVNSMKQLLENKTPNLILTGQSCQDQEHLDVIDQTVTLAGKDKRIPTISVSDFWTNRVPYFSDIFSKRGKFKFLPDYITVIDEFAKEIMIKEGFPEEKLVITGNPHFDNLESKARKFTEEEKKTLREQIGLGSDLLVFYAAGIWKKDKDNFGFWDLDNIYLINEVLDDLPKKQKEKTGLVIKLHPDVPAEDSEEISRYINQYSNGRIKLVKDIEAQELVLASDLTLTHFSTVGIEAVYMGKPCISLQPGSKGEDYIAFITQKKIIPVGYNIEDCKTLVKKTIINKEYRERELIEKASSFRTDGKATERVTDLVYKMIR